MCPAGQGVLRGWLNPQEPTPQVEVILSSTAHGLGGEERSKERRGEGRGGGQAPSQSTPPPRTTPSGVHIIRGENVAFWI